jgi:hypothetical protein
MDGQNYYNPDVNYTVYRIRNLVNRRCYVGSTKSPETGSVSSRAI